MTVTNVTNGGKTVSFTPALKYLHWGGLAKTTSADSVDESAQVAMLDRNIKLQSDNATDANGYGYDLKIVSCGPEGAHVHSVECTRGGKQTVLGTYPLHFHLMHDLGRYASFVNNSVHHNYQRCITVHGTNNSLVENNVCHDTFGHGFFLEDGSEVNNTFINNLGLTIRNKTNLLLPTDETAAVFWISNPMNYFRNNVAAGGDSKGFWMAFAHTSTGPTFSPFICPDTSPLFLFDNNTVHSCEDGLFLDGGPDNNTHVATETNYNPRSIPCDTTSPQVNATISNFLAYKNRNRGSWTSGSGIVFENITLADNKIGMTDAANTLGSYCFNCHFIGITNNNGTVVTPCEVAVGRSFGNHSCDFPIRGFEFYDGPRRLISGSCSGFIPTAFYQASCLSVLRFDEDSITPYSFVGTFDVKDSSKVVYFAKDFGDGATSVSFIDQEGNITGFIGGSVSVNNNFLFREGCINKTQSNAFYCPANNLGSLSIINTHLNSSCSSYDIHTLVNQTLECNTTIDRIITSQQVIYGSKPTLRFVRNDLPYYTHNLIGNSDGDSGNMTNYPSVEYFTTTLLNHSISAYWSFQIPPNFYIFTDNLSGTTSDYIDINICIPETAELLSVQRYFTTNTNDTASIVPQIPANNTSFNTTTPGSFYQIVEFNDFKVLHYRLGFDGLSNLYLNLNVSLNTLYSSCNFDKLIAPPTSATASPIPRPSSSSNPHPSSSFNPTATSSLAPNPTEESSDISSGLSDSTSNSSDKSSSGEKSSASSLSFPILLVVALLVIYF